MVTGQLLIVAEDATASSIEFNSNPTRLGHGSDSPLHVTGCCHLGICW